MCVAYLRKKLFSNMIILTIYFIWFDGFQSVTECNRSNPLRTDYSVKMAASYTTGHLD
jgi:hypothetical protein